MKGNQDLRIYDHPDRTFDRGDPVSLIFEGKIIRGYTKEPVAVAMFAAGEPVTMRSFKYHRPRGMFCLNGKCASCLVRIDGIPNQKACQVRCKDGMQVERQTKTPNASWDFLFANDFFFSKKLDYHHMFTRPEWLNNFLGKVVRKFSGIGDLPDHQADKSTTIRDIECDVLVIGAGPAGIGAAISASSAKADVILIDDQRRPGGHLLSYPETVEDGLSGITWCAERTAELIDKGVRFFNENEVIGYYSEGYFAAVKEGGLLRLHPKKTIIATGAYDQNFVFSQSDLPNIVSARGLEKLTIRFGVCPGKRAFILGSDDTALSLALRLPGFGVQVVGVAEPGNQILGNADWAEKIQSRGIPILLNYKPTSAIGRFRLKGIELSPIDGGETIRTQCDLIAVSAPLAPAYELAAQAKVNVHFSLKSGGYIPEHDKIGRTNIPDIFVAGEIRGNGTVPEIRKQGWIAGFSAALDLYPSQKVKAKLKQLMNSD